VGPEGTPAPPRADVEPAITPAAEPLGRLLRIRWQPAYRLVPERLPTASLWDRSADEEDFQARLALETLTNQRVRDEIGSVEQVAASERRYGPGAGLVMAPFTHLNPGGSEFSDGSFGVLYGSSNLPGATAEVLYHHQRFLVATAEPAGLVLRLRVVTFDVDAQLYDAQRDPEASPDRIASGDWSGPRALGARLRRAGVTGVLYRSGRHTGSKCIALFTPRVVSNARTGQVLSFYWDGRTLKPSDA
jgi:hypothetical protein